MVDVLDPLDVSFRDVTEMWEAFDGIERLASNAKTLLAARVEDAGAWKRAGARSAAEHLARLGGTTTSAARAALETSKNVAELPATSDAMRAGALSAAQAAAVAAAAVADPAAEARLFDLAATTNVSGLREECLRTTAAADPDRDATHRRIHAGRYLRTFTDGEGGRNLHARGTAEVVARLERALEPFIDDLFEKGRVEERHEAREAYAFDALMLLAERDPEADERKRTAKPRYTSLLHVPFEALVRGAVAGEEMCEIVGVGPIPVRVARELLGDSILKLVITKGVDVVNVVHLGRGPTAAQRIALLWTSPRCSNIECSGTFTEIDHRKPWVTTKHTVLDELDPLCSHCHSLKTHRGWALVDGKGRRKFVGPNDLRHPHYKPPP